MQGSIAFILVLLCVEHSWAHLTVHTPLLQTALADGGSSRSMTQYGLPSSNVMRLRGGMDQMAAYLLCRMGGNENPSLEDVKKVLNSVEAKVDEDRINHLVRDLNGKDIQELLEQAKKEALENAQIDRFLDAQSAPNAAGAQAGAASKAAPPDAAAEGKKEKAKAAKKESSSDSLDGDMGFGLFD
uniref:60S acidic ribosomal protein P2 n=1 Tax=Hanusia phi TaxID=3032 RepID=A0A7S0HDT0_9CRYP|mmetsp:Transcript_21557/g.48837  ORF Transcript_21557/g.48837 Transcript_21557/m.48837 type:complete len:185 (+) Transcript_21557:255-809(+)